MNTELGKVYSFNGNVPCNTTNTVPGGQKDAAAPMIFQSLMRQPHK